MFCDDKEIPRDAERRRPVFPYHGMRLPPRFERFSVEGIFARKIEFDFDKSVLEIMVHFSVPVDPRTLNERNVLLNGIPAGRKARFEYNRTGNIVRVTIAEPDDEYSLEFLELTAFNGEPLEHQVFTGIKDGFFFYGNMEEWKGF